MMGGLRKHRHMFSEISHDIPRISRIISLSPNIGQSGLRNPLNIVLSPEQAEEWCEQSQIKRFKPFVPHLLTSSGHEAMARPPPSSSDSKSKQVLTINLVVYWQNNIVNSV